MTEIEIQQLKERLKEKFEENQHLSQEVYAWKTRISWIHEGKLRAEEAEKVLEEKISKLEKELVEEKKKTSEFEEEILEKDRKLEEFKESPESDQKTLGIQNSSENEKLENLEKELLNFKTDHDKILGEKNEEIQGLKSEISACNKENEELNFENLKIQKELQKKEKNLEKELLNLKADHEKILGEKNEEIQGLKSENSELKSRISEIENSKNEEIQKLNAKLEIKGEVMEQLFEQLANASISEDKNKKKYSNPNTVVADNNLNFWLFFTVAFLFFVLVSLFLTR